MTNQRMTLDEIFDGERDRLISEAEAAEAAMTPEQRAKRAADAQARLDAVPDEPEAPLTNVCEICGWPMDEDGIPICEDCEAEELD